jgi:hypothetical protein
MLNLISQVHTRYINAFMIRNCMIAYKNILDAEWSKYMICRGDLIDSTRSHVKIAVPNRVQKQSISL